MTAQARARAPTASRLLARPSHSSYDLATERDAGTPAPTMEDAMQERVLRWFLRRLMFALNQRNMGLIVGLICVVLTVIFGIVGFGCYLGRYSGHRAQAA